MPTQDWRFIPENNGVFIISGYYCALKKISNIPSLGDGGTCPFHLNSSEEFSFTLATVPRPFGESRE